MLLQLLLSLAAVSANALGTSFAVLVPSRAFVIPFLEDPLAPAISTARGEVALSLNGSCSAGFSVVCSEVQCSDVGTTITDEAVQIVNTTCLHGGCSIYRNITGSGMRLSSHRNIAPHTL